MSGPQDNLRAEITARLEPGDHLVAFGFVKHGRKVLYLLLLAGAWIVWLVNFMLGDGKPILTFIVLGLCLIPAAFAFIENRRPATALLQRMDETPVAVVVKTRSRILIYRLVSRAKTLGIEELVAELDPARTTIEDAGTKLRVTADGETTTFKIMARNESDLAGFSVGPPAWPATSKSA